MLSPFIHPAPFLSLFNNNYGEVSYKLFADFTVTKYHIVIGDVIITLCTFLGKTLHSIYFKIIKALFGNLKFFQESKSVLGAQ